MPYAALMIRAARSRALPAVALACATLLAAVGAGWKDPAAATGPELPAVTMGDYPVDEFTDEARMLPAELTASIQRDLALTPAEYAARAAASIDAVEVVAALQHTGVDVLGSRMEGTELVVNVPAGSDTAGVIASGAAVEQGAPDELDLTDVEFVPAFDVAGGDGYAWTGTDGVSHQCSVGFAGYRKSDGRPVALTAGHCVAGMSNIRGVIRQLVQNSPGPGGEFGQAIGSPGASAFGDGFDGGLIALDGAGATQRAAVLTWGGGAKAPRSSAVVPITGQSAAIAGAALCKSGSRTGWTCGTVRAVDQTVNVGGSRVNSILASTCIQPGDSGGAAVIGQVAVGINSSTSSAPCGSPDYISAFFPMQSAAGKPSAQSQFGSVWEPAIAVPEPTIDALSVPTEASAGSISGTTSAAKVTIRVDDASAPILTVPSDAGSWSVDLADLARRGITAGEHRLTVVAVGGTWSRSSGVGTTVTFAGSPPAAVSGLLPADHVQR